MTVSTLPRARRTPAPTFRAACLIAASAAPTLAFAQSDADVTHARDAFELGVLLGRSDRWAEAMEAFRRSHALAPRPRTCFNLGLALHHVGRLREAARTLRQCLDAPDSSADASLVYDARNLLGVLTRSLATFELVIEPAHAELRVDGEPIVGSGPTRRVELDPGSHRVQLAAEGMGPQEFSVQLAAGQRVLRRADLHTLPARMVIRAPSSQAAVSVDDDPAGRGVTEWTGPPGTHRVRVELADHHPWRHAYTLTPGQRLDLAITLDPVSRPLHENPWLWVGVGAAVVTIGAVIAYALTTGDLPVDAGTTGQIIPVGTR